MANWFHIFPKRTGLSPYVWLIFCILPFYFIFKSSSVLETIYGILLVILFFTSYGLSYVSKGWPVYVWVSFQIVISIAMTSLFGYIYFSLFLAFFIGNIRNKIGFFTLYSINLVSVIVTINIGFLTKNPIFFTQSPFILISVFAVILLPFTTYNRNKHELLEEKLEDVNKRISELVKLEERQRIARDLHDTLGQKLSLIGLKSDLAGKLLSRNVDAAQDEINDIRQTARAALKEVREMVSDMRGTRLEEEVIHVKQILQAASIDFQMKGNVHLENTPLLVENVLSMCLKEAVTNIVKHSQASCCTLIINQSSKEVHLKIVDNGVGLSNKVKLTKGNGLLGMKERLEFVNGNLDIQTQDGATINITVPNVIMQSRTV
ncbi:sensor histidine kinase [Peribacillus psychrosaccharolyticus]|uniref:histidine kinase n=1 Tax=Peribacillus psychrosaccharolyticus TaxID=1407 RepID=A0A974NK77_PERPY|nr:sensor histidine kinase [Peribacillus psychrosaccharolyticus]MEC2055584.1 sensor histidine kinase [Peribacillus psychrosaccharolyticus]MED3743389.1 sensor histidine kinase [Peribacillus psychrosaccharolyticus]QQS99250.1 sensor histidine kinase [Peribacillus psychrosaccharolyticus]